MKNRNSLLALVVLIFTSSLAYGAFREVARFKFEGVERWDYLTVDPLARRLYLARSNRIMVIDPDTGQNLGEVGGLDGAHGTALDPEDSLGFATSGKSGEVVVFDLKTLKILSRIKAGEGPDAIVYNPTSKRVLAFNGKSRSVTIIDAKTRQVLATLPLAGRPEFAVSDDSAKVFVNLEDKNALVEIDTNLLKVVSTHSLLPCKEPTGLSIDQKSKRLIVGCGNQLAAVVDASSGIVLQSFKVGRGVDATAFDSRHQLAFISAGEGMLTILSEDSAGFHPLQNVPTAPGARTLAVDDKTGRAFLPIASFQKGSPRPPVIDGTFALLVVGSP